jgi:hypothetical protein
MQSKYPSEIQPFNDDAFKRICNIYDSLDTKWCHKFYLKYSKITRRKFLKLLCRKDTVINHS